MRFRTQSLERPTPLRATGRGHSSAKSGNNPRLGPDVVTVEIVNIAGVDVSEAPFVGEQHHELVDHVLTEFERGGSFGWRVT